MKFSLDDRHRSIRRFVMNALGAPPWTVRTERQPVADEQRPVAVVEVATPAATLRARTSVPQGDVERQQSFALMLYPELLGTAAESRQRAAEVAELLMNAVGMGLDADDGSRLSGPEMLPVYDFEAVPVKGALRAGPAESYGWLRVQDFPVHALQDPEDPLRWTVACTLRVSWEQGGRVVSPDVPMVGSFGGSWREPVVPVQPPPIGAHEVTLGHGPPPPAGVPTRFYFDQDSGLLYERTN